MVLRVGQGLLWLRVPQAERFFVKAGQLHDGITGGLFTYILFWTLAYGMVHVF